MGCQRWIVHRYLAREALRPWALALLVLTGVVLTRELLGLSDLVVNRGLGVGAVGRLAGLQALAVAAAVFPLAVLIGVLAALGRLGADREILALEACGVPGRRLARSAMAFAGAMALCSLLLSVAAAPWAQRSLDRRLDALVRSQPWAGLGRAGLRAGVIHDFGAWRLEARQVSARGDALRGILLYSPELGETLFAREGTLTPNGPEALELTLREARVVLSAGSPRALRFERMTVPLPAIPAPARSRAERLAGLTLAELWQATREPAGPFPRASGAAPSAQGLRAAHGTPLPRPAIELQRRFATPAATFAMALLAVPLFLGRRHASRAAGGVLGVGAAVAYFALLQLGEGLIQTGLVGVAAGVWLPPALLAALAAGLLSRQRFRERPRQSCEGARGVLRRGAGRSASRTRSRATRRRALPRYVAGRFVGLSLLAFSALLAGYLLVDVLERLDWFARYRATGTEVLRFYAVRTPLLAARVVPLALLVGTALTASLLAAEGELLGMRACGIPASRALAPLLGVCVLVTPAYFALTDGLLPRTNARADELKRSEIKQRYYRELAEQRKVAVWRRAGSQLLQALRFDTERGDAREVTIYEIGESGLPRSRSDARAAHHIGQGVWRLVEPRRVELVDGRARRVEAPRYAELGDALPAEVDTMHLSSAALVREIAAVEADGYDATRLRVDLHTKLARPLACVLLPAAALVHAVGGPPFPGPARMLLLSGALGIGYMLLVGVCASLGHGGSLPPPLAGWAPALLTGVAIPLAAAGAGAGRRRVST